MTYKFISWNIDSLNAALTGTSDRAALSMAVVDQLATSEADVIAIQETKLNGDLKKTNKVFDVLASSQNMKLFTVSVHHLHVKVTREQCFFIRKVCLNQSSPCLRLERQSPWIAKVVSSP